MIPVGRQLSPGTPALAERALYQQICGYIDRHLQSEALTPLALAVAFKISRATLYRLFEPVGGVAAFVKERRLAQVHRLLSAPDRRHHLATLAESHGFADASTLSRAFKQHFGYSPSEARTLLPSAPGTRQSAPAASSIGDWMRTLRD